MDGKRKKCNIAADMWADKKQLVAKYKLLLFIGSPGSAR